MWFKSTFGGVFIVCVLLLLNTTTAQVCKLIDEDGKEYNLLETQTIALAEIADNEPIGVIATFQTEGVVDVPSSGTTDGYMSCSFNKETNEVQISLSDNFQTWEKDKDASINFFSKFDITCSTTRSVEFSTRVTTFSNNYKPEFLDQDGSNGYEITLPMPLASGYRIAGECAKTIQVVDYDYRAIFYLSRTEITLSGEFSDSFSVSSTQNGNTVTVTLQTAAYINTDTDITLTLTATDVLPDGTTADSVDVSFVLKPDVVASTPPAPYFTEPLHVYKIAGDGSFEPQTITFVEGYVKGETTVELKHGTGEELKDYFEVIYNENDITIQQSKTRALTDDILNGYFGALVLEANRNGVDRTGSTVLHFTLPGYDATPPPTMVDL